MRTEKQQAVSRANGAKSQGPTTPEGKAASANNATTHGLTARNPLLLNVEQQAAFDAYRADYINSLSPDGPVETDLVEEMVAVQWHRQRDEGAEAARTPPGSRWPWSTSTTNGRALGNFQRHSLRLSRQFLRLHKTLRDLQAERAQSQPAQPEPVPAQVTTLETQNAQNEPGDEQPQPQQPDTPRAPHNAATALVEGLLRKPATSDHPTEEATECAGN